MEHDADLAVVAPDRRARAPVVGQRVEQAAAAVRVGAGLGQPEDDLGARVVERERERGADVLRLRAAVADVVEEAAQQPHALEALAREAAVDDAWRRSRSGRNASAAASVATDAANAEPLTSWPATSATSA